MRITIMLLAILAIALAWTGGWYYVEGEVSVQLDKLVEKLKQKEKSVTCDEREVTGYPFRINLSCSGFGYIDRENGHRYSASSLRTASQVYQPGKMVVELDPPGKISLDEKNYDTGWESLRASISANLEGPLRFSFHGRSLVLSETSAIADTVRISDFQIHGRRNGEQDVDYAVSAAGVSSALNQWTGFGTDIRIKLMDIYDKLLEETDLRKVGRRHGLSGHLDQLVYKSENGGELGLVGPFSTSRDGNISGKFEVTINNAAALVDALEQVLPDYQNEISLFARALEYTGLGQTGTVSLTVSVKNGQAAIGFIPVATLPPVY